MITKEYDFKGVQKSMILKVYKMSMILKAYKRV